MNKNMNFLLIFQEVWVNSQWLQKNGVPYKTILNGIKKNKDKKSSLWEEVKHSSYGTNPLINYSTVPLTTIKRYNLPNREEALKFAVDLTQEVPELNECSKLPFLFCRLEVAASSQWSKHLIFYDSLPIKNFIKEKLAVSHAVFQEIIDMRENGEKFKTIFYAFKALQFNHNFYFKTESLQYFCKKINNASSTSIEDTLTHSLFSSKSNNKKLDRIWELKANELFRSKNKLTIQGIVDQLNKERDQRGLNLISYSTILRFLKKPDNLNKNLLIRDGESAYRQSHLSYLKMQTKGVHEAWEIDGTRMPFLVKTDNKMGIGVLQFVIVIDVFTKKIIGFSIDKSENSKMIKEALQRAISSTLSLPKLLVHDGASGFGSNELDQIKYTTGIQGTIWRKHSPGRPQEKGTIERVNSTLNTSIFKHFDGFLGEGIKSKREFAHPSKEELLRFRKKNNVRSYREVLKVLIESISMYNSKSFKNKKSPSEVYRDSMRKKGLMAGIKIRPELLALGFFEKANLIVKRSMVEFERSSKKHTYVIPENRRLSLNGCRVLLVYNQHDFSKVHIFEPKTEKYICELTEEIKINRISSNRSKEENSHVNKRSIGNKDYIKRIYNEIKEEEEELSKLEEDNPTMSFLIPGIDDKEILKEVELSMLLNSVGLANTGSDEEHLNKEKKPENFSLRKENGKIKIS